MNYHYINYMIKERRRDELEACERRRLLNTVSSSHEGLICRVINRFVNVFLRMWNQVPVRNRFLHPCSSLSKSFVEIKEEG